MGLIAEEVNQVIPEIVNLNKDGLVDALEYSRLTALLVEAIKELNVKIENQNIFINELLNSKK